MYWAPDAKALAIHFCHSVRHRDCDEMPGSSDQCATTACTLLSRGSCDDKKRLYILNIFRLCTMLRKLPLPALDNFESGFGHCIYTSRCLGGLLNFPCEISAKQGSTAGALMNFFVPSLPHFE